MNYFDGFIKTENFDNKNSSEISQNKIKNYKIENYEKFLVKSEPKEVKNEPENFYFNFSINLPKPKKENENKIKSEFNKFQQKFTCDLCSYETIKKCQISSHMEKIHSNKNQKIKTQKFTCEICEKSFKNLRLLFCHKSTHNSSKIKCEVCEKFLKVTTFKEHLREVHATEFNFHCLICNQFYKTKKTLKRHQKIHNKKFECDICHHRFARGDVLNKHLEVHSKPESSFEGWKMIRSQNNFNKFRAKSYDKRILKFL